MSSEKKCCVPGCSRSSDSDTVLHLFPNPVKDIDRFKLWLFNIGGDILAYSNDYIYKRRRVCHAHFEVKYCCRYNRISNIAVPTLNLPGPSKVNIYTTSIEQTPLRAKENMTDNLPSSSQVSQLLDTEQNRCPISAPVTETKNESILPECKINSELSQGDPVQQKRCRVLKKVVCLKSKLTKSELNIYKALVNVKVKLSKLKSKSKKQMAALKSAKKLYTNASFIKAIESMPSPGRLITLMQFREGQKQGKGRRFSLQEKLVSLAIMKKSPKAYKFLRKMFVLPSAQTLTVLLNNTNIGVGINRNIFSQLKSTAEKMTIEEKLCILMFDEMSIKPSLSFNSKKDSVTGFVTTMDETRPTLADHAQVFMMRGLTKNYKQPVAYTFASGATSGPELAKQIKIVVKEMQQAGFVVIATVCDQSTNNSSAIKILINETKKECLLKGVVPKENVIKINEQEIIPIFDPPHLLKGIRNNLITKNLIFEINGQTKLAKWDHIELLLKENPGYKGIRLVPKLTENHVDPKKISKMKVKYAAQIFSQTVASNMGYLADKGILPEECKDTADLLLFFDELFDSVNGSFLNKKRYSKPLLQAVKPNSTHHKKWHEFKKILSTMRFVKKSAEKTESVPSLKNWIFTLDGIQTLVQKLGKDYEITSLWMRHLNQDPLENFFGAIRSHGCRNINPVPDGFQSAYAALLVNNLSSIQAPGANCQNDYCEALVKLMTNEDCEANNNPITQEVDINKILNIHVVPIEEKSNPKVMAPLQYVSGYIINKSKKIFKKCQQCNLDTINSHEIEYIKYREYSNKRWLCSPTDSMITLFSAFQDIINDELKEDLARKNISQYIKLLIYTVVDLNKFHCNKHKDKLIDYIINLSIRFFIYTYCKTLNKIMTGMQETIDETDKNQIMAKNYYKRHCKRPKKN